MKKVRFLLFLLAALLCLAACKSLPTLKPHAPGYLHSDGRLYFEAPASYLAAKRSKEATARLIDAVGERLLYSAGKGLLCDENGELYAIDGTFFPSLANFSPDRVSICKEEVVRTELAASTDGALTESIVAAFETDLLDPEDFGLLQEFSTTRYLLLLFSEDYPDFCFKLEYSVIEKGDDLYEAWPYNVERVGVLYDRNLDCCALAPASLYQLLTGGLS